jgi:hypothetical protein
MIYNWELATGQQISVDNQGAQTVVTILSSSAGQQQRSSNSFNTGIWIVPPEISITPTGATLKITTPSGESIMQVQGNSIRLQTSHDGEQQSTSSSSTSSFASGMAPMQPLQMGNMQMNMQPMTMKMGNMELNMPTTASQPRFCSQCGTPVKSVDKFCASCGHKLES